MQITDRRKLKINEAFSDVNFNDDNDGCNVEMGMY